jgi:hypothetical protein
MKSSKFPNGLTVKELKEMIKDWPETNEHGQLTEVWVETDWSTSSVVTEIQPLNMRGDVADLILKSDAFEAPTYRTLTRQGLA